MVGVGRFPLSVWLLAFLRRDVTSGGVTWPTLMRVFSGARNCGLLDLRDPTIEIISTFCILRSLGPVNSGPNSVEILCFFFVSILTTERPLALVLITECSLALLLCSRSSALYIRLVMSTLSRPTSSSFSSFSSFSSSHSSFLFVFFFFVLYHRFLVGRGGRGATSGRGS